LPLARYQASSSITGEQHACMVHNLCFKIDPNIRADYFDIAVLGDMVVLNDSE